MEIKFIKKSEFQPAGHHSLLWQYWRTLYREARNDIPLRTSLRPDQIASLIPYLTILDMIDEDTVSILLIGSAHDQMWSRNIIADNFLDHLSGEARQKYKDLFISLKNYRLGCVTEEVVTTASGTTLRCSGLLLPLRANTGETTASVGYFTYEGIEEDFQDLMRNGPSDRCIENVTFISMDD
ncbi:PAS domain-containing protein [Kordiimonas lipolytica]|uniref:PAS domain-containing protein n=1 Tax=Kordiimonas lipolytica TaxID=1662421 RepID=A0ABV8U7V7_9PROT|nr:PAS domain-containing protein [Kordiimonas lipolytica]